MSVEHQPRANETAEQGNQAELQSMGRERLEQLAHDTENANENAQERADRARETIHHHEAEPTEPVAAAETTEPPAKPSLAPHLDRTLNYKHTLASVQRHLQPASRVFSQLIHTPAVEQISEALENTVMRPSIVAGATWTAALVGLIFYITARYYGYPLSGTEMLAALAGGALLGILLEGLLRLLRRH